MSHPRQRRIVRLAGGAVPHRARGNLKPAIWALVERLRQEMARRWQEVGNLRDPTVLRLSHRLDRVLTRALAREMEGGAADRRAGGPGAPGDSAGIGQGPAGGPGE